MYISTVQKNAVEATKRSRDEKRARDQDIKEECKKARKRFLVSSWSLERRKLGGI